MGASADSFQVGRQSVRRPFSKKRHDRCSIGSIERAIGRSTSVLDGIVAVIVISQQSSRDREELCSIATDKLVKGFLFPCRESGEEECFVTVRIIYR